MFNVLADDDILALLLTNGDAKQQQQWKQQAVPPAKRFRLDASPAASDTSSLPLSTCSLIGTKEATGDKGISPPVFNAEHSIRNQEAPAHHTMPRANQDWPQTQDMQQSANTQPRVPSLGATNGRFVPPRRTPPGPATDQQVASEGQQHPSVVSVAQRYRETLPGCPASELRFPSGLIGPPQRHAIVPDTFASCVQYKACWTRALHEEIQIRRDSHICLVCSDHYCRCFGTFAQIHLGMISAMQIKVVCFRDPLWKYVLTTRI